MNSIQGGRSGQCWRTAETKEHVVLRKHTGKTFLKSTWGSRSHLINSRMAKHWPSQTTLKYARPLFLQLTSNSRLKKTLFVCLVWFLRKAPRAYLMHAFCQQVFTMSLLYIIIPGSKPPDFGLKWWKQRNKKTKSAPLTQRIFGYLSN